MSKFEGNAITWFEVPTTNIERAVDFYETLLETRLQEFPGEEPCFMFPAGEAGIAGRQQWAINLVGKLDEVLTRAHTEGAVLMPRTQIPGGFGFYACIQDSEGNHVGLHSR